MVFCVSSRRPASTPAWRSWFILVLVLLGPLLARGADEDLPISLPEELLPELNAIIERALAAAPSVQLANIQLARAEANFLIHRAGMLPTVNAYGSYNVSTQRREGDTASQSDDQGFFYQVGLSQPLFHWGARKAERDIGELALLIEQRNFDDARARLASALRTQYLDLIIRKLDLRNARRAQELNRQGVEAAETRFSKGEISEAEITNVRLSAEDAALAVRRSEHDLETHLRIFAHLAGDPSFTAEQIADAIPAPLFSPDLLERRFSRLSSEVIRDLPSAEVHELQMQQNEKRYDIERVRLRPKVSLTATHGLVNLTTATTATIDQTAVVTTTAGVTVNWTLFDGLASRGARRAALAAKRAGERQYESFLETTLNELRRLQREIGLSVDSLSLTERRTQLVRDALERAEADFAAGRIARSSLDAHITQVRATEVNLARSRSHLLGRWVEYVSLAGLDPRRQLPVRSAPRASTQEAVAPH